MEYSEYARSFVFPVKYVESWSVRVRFQKGVLVMVVFYFLCLLIE